MVQAAPALFDREVTVEKMGQLMAAAAAQGANLVSFPEALIVEGIRLKLYTNKTEAAISG